MAGAFATVVTCIPGEYGEKGPCPEGYVQGLENIFVIPAAEASAIQTFLNPFDPVMAGQYFLGALTLTFSIWFAAWSIGSIVKAVRRF